MSADDFYSQQEDLSTSAQFSSDHVSSMNIYFSAHCLTLLEKAIGNKSRSFFLMIFRSSICFIAAIFDHYLLLINKLASENLSRYFISKITNCKLSDETNC